MSAEFSKRVRDIVWARAGGRCEVCGRVSTRLEFHHRKYRSRGGDGGAANCLLLCGFGNAAGCHGHAHSGGIFGAALSAGDNPEQVPVSLYRFPYSVSTYLTDDGRVITGALACWEHGGAGEAPLPGCGWCKPSGGVLWDYEHDKGEW